MSARWLLPDAVFSDGRLLSGQAVCLDRGRVAAVAPVGHEPATPLTGILAPGFVDLQVNGGGGTLFNDDPTPEGLRTIAGAHRRFGTAAIAPTVITDSAEVIDAAADAVIAVRDDLSIIGIHIEGPHIDTARRGTHPARHIRPYDGQTRATARRLREAGIPVMLTLSPHAIAPEEITELAAMGVTVSLGHTEASLETARAAIAAGAASATHLLNAMPPIRNRDPGIVAAVLDAGLPAGIIADGHHIDDTLLRLILRTAQPDTLFLVSDAMPTIGGPDHFSLTDTEVRLENGRLINSEGTLAGAHITQGQGVARLVQHLGQSLEIALRMALTLPATLMGRPELAGMQGRPADDVILLDGTGTYVSSLSEALVEATRRTG